jgi:hypothetical protein
LGLQLWLCFFPKIVNVFARNSRTRSSTGSRVGHCFPAGSCMSTRLSPEQGLHQIPKSAVLRSSRYRQLRFQASACSWLLFLAESRSPNSAHSRIRDFTGSKLPRIANSLLLKKHTLRTFVKLNVSRVTDFPEFPTPGPKGSCTKAWGSPRNSVGIGSIPWWHH